MTDHSGADNSDVVRPLSGLSGVRLALAFVARICVIVTISCLKVVQEQLSVVIFKKKLANRACFLQSQPSGFSDFRRASELLSHHRSCDSFEKHFGLMHFIQCWRTEIGRSALHSFSPLFILVVCGSLLTFCITGEVNAQVPSQSGLSRPDVSKDPIDRGASNPSRPQSRTKSTDKSQIRQTSFIENDDEIPDKNPFQLDEPLVDVIIEGNQTIIDSEIAKHIKTRPGRPATQKQIKDDVDALVRTRWFASVEPTLRPTDEGMVLVFRVLERPIVRRVEYKGLRKMKQKVFDSLTQLKPGSPFDISANRECARRIEEHYHEKGFAYATVELEKGNDRDDREVVFLIHEGPKVHVTSVKFDGNKEFIDGILVTKTRTKTRILWLFGGKYDPSTIRDDIEGVKQYYHSLGYFDVDIKEHLKHSNDRSKIEIHYEVSEGIRYKIRNIELDGNQVLTEDEIRDMMKVNGDTFYNAHDLQKDVDAIRTKYGTQGRLKCQVDAVPRFTEDPGIVDIVYRINEDQVYRIRKINVHIQGDHPHTQTKLVRNISPIQPGDLADPKKINQLKHKLSGSGYFSAGQDNGVRVEAKDIDTDSWIAKAQYGSVRSQSADGAKPTPTTLYKRTVKQPEPPRVFAPQAATPNGLMGLYGWVGSEASREESRDPFVSVTPHFDNIARPVIVADNPPKQVVDDGLSPVTPIFRAQSMDPLRPPASFGFDAGPEVDPYGKALANPEPPPAFTDLDLTVGEGQTGKLMFGVGVNSNAGLVGNIVLSEQNFDILNPPTSWNDIVAGKAWRGAGQKFKIEAQPGTQVSRYLIDWQNPYFMDTDYNLGVSGFYFLRYYRNWYEERVGGRVRVGRQVTQHWSANVALRLEDVDIYNPTTPSPQSLTNVLGYTLLSTVRGSVIHDTRDAAFNSGQGHYFELSYEQAFGQFNYPRVEAEARQYFTTYRRVDGQGKHTVSVRGNVGWSGSDTPIYEHFFAGGFQNFRGFSFRGVSPVDSNVYVGGNFMALGSLEYMLPVTANEMVKMVGFTDFGTINNGISLDNFRLSVGTGFRLSIPMMGPVPIAIDFAVPILQQSTDIKQVVSFYVGVNR